MTRRQFTGGVGAVAASLAWGVHTGATAETRRELRVGAAEARATPKAEGTFLIGPMGPSTGIHDALYVRAMVLSDGERSTAIVTLDYLGFDRAYNEVLIEAASKATGIPAAHILINASHTHSAPLTAPWGPWKEKRRPGDHELLPSRVAEVTRAAQERLEPARLRYRREPTQIGFHRRTWNGRKIVMAPNPHGAVLPWVDVLSAESVGGELIAVLFSHAAHPVIVHAASTLISADYPGFAVDTLRRQLGKNGDTVFLFAQGCCGNVNGFPLKGGIDAAAAAGRDLGEAVLRAIRSGSQREITGKLRVQARDIELPLQSPPPMEALERKIAGERDDERRQRLAELIEIAHAAEPRNISMPLRALAIGNLCLLGLGHEPFAEYHHHIEARSPFEHNMALGYTNALECYVGTAKDYALGDRGGYETSPWGAAFRFESRLPLAARAEGMLHGHVDDLLTTVYKRS